MKVFYTILLLFLSVFSLSAEEIKDTFLINNGDNYIIDDYPDFNNRGFRYFQDYIDFSSAEDDNKLLVNTVNGNLIYSRIDYESGEIGLPIKLAFTYNSGSSFIGRYGNFWQSNYGLRLISNNVNNHKIFVSPDDRTELFIYDNDKKTFSATNYFRDSLKIVNDKIELTFYDDFLSQEKTKIKAVFDNIKSHFPTYLLDKYGNRISYNYSEQGKIQTINFPSGRHLLFQYDGDLLSKVIVPGGREINYIYDENNNLISVISQSGEAINYYYDECNHLVKIESNSKEILIAYDDDYRVSAIQNHYDNLIYTLKYDDKNKTTTLNYPNNSTKYFKYDDKERSTEYGYNNKMQQKVSWNEYNLISTRSDAQNHTTKYQYDDLNNILSITEPGNKKINFTWDYNSNILIYNYKGIATTQYKFNQYNDLSFIEKVGANPISYYRDMNGLLTEVNIGNDITINFNFDMYGQISRVNINNNEQLHLKYNNDGLISEIKDIFSNSSYFFYDDNHKLINIRYADGSEEGVYYSDNYKNAIFVKKNGETVNYSYDNLNRLISIQDESDNIINFNYDKYNQIIISIDNINNTIKFNDLKDIYEININGKSIINYDYNSLGQISKIKHNAMEHLFTYNLNNLVSKYTNPAGLTLTYQYNDFKQLTQSTDALGNTIKYRYDDFGNMITKSIGQLNINLDYYIDNRIKSISYGTEKQISFDYDEYGFLKSKNYNKSNSINYEYDKFGLLKSEIINNIKTRDYFYNSSYNIDSIHSNYEFNTYFKYDNSGKIIEKYSNSAYRNTYEYDKKSRLISITNENNNSAKYSWDKFSNLSSYSDNNSNEYLFDFSQNKISITYPNQSNYTYEGLNSPLYFKIDKISNADNSIINLLYSNNYELINLIDYYSNQFKIEYLSNRLISSFINSNSETFIFTYDNTKRLININNPENQNKTFTYNNQNQISELNDYSNFNYQLRYYNLEKLLSIKTENFDIIYSYNNENLLSEFNINDNMKLYYSYDNFGNLRSIINQNNDTSKFDFNIFSQIIKKTLPNNEEIFYLYNSKDLLQKVQGNNYIFEINYDKNYNLSSILLNSNNLISLQYNNINKISNSNTIHSNIDYSYNINNLLLQKTRKDGYSEQYSYDYLARIINRKVANNERESFSYDKKGNLIEYTDKQGLSHNYSYNYKNQLKKIRWSKRDSINLAYDNNGNMSQIILPNGITSSFTWLSFSQLNSINIFSSGKLNFKHNSNSANLIINNSDTIRYSFDNLYRFNGISGLSEIAFDKLGAFINSNILSYQSDSPNYKFAHIQNQILPDRIIFDNINYGILYDENYRLMSITLNNNKINEFSYNNSGLLSKIKNEENIFKIDYFNFDKINKINWNDKYILNFTYGHNQLLSEIKDDFSNSYKMNYDNLGNINRISKSDNSKIEILFDNNSNILIKRNEAYDEIAYYYNEQNLPKSTMYPELNNKTIDYDILHNFVNIRTDRTILQNYDYSIKPFKLSSTKQVNINNLLDLSLNIDKDKSLKINNNNVSQKNYIDNELQSVLLQNNQSITIDNIDDTYKISLPDSSYYIFENINNSRDKIAIYDKNNTLLSELQLTYDNDKITEIKENSVQKIGFDYDYLGRLIGYTNYDSITQNIDYSTDGRIAHIRNNIDTIEINYDENNRISTVKNIELTYDLSGNIIQKSYLDSNKLIDFSYNSNGQLRYIMLDSSEITELFYSPFGKLIGIKSKNSQFEIPFEDTRSSDKFTKIKMDTLGNITQINELINFKNINIAYKYINKSKRYIFPIFSRDLTSLGYIQNDKFISLSQNITPFEFQFDSLNLIDKDILLLRGMQYLSEINLYYDGEKFFDSEIYCYLQEEKFIDRSLNLKEKSQKETHYAIPEEKLYPILKPYDNRFSNIKDEANPNKILAGEINHHFNNFLNYNTLLFSDYDLDKISSYNIEKTNPKDLYNHNFDRNIIISAKLPSIMLDTILLESNNNIIPKLMPKRPLTSGINQIIDYLKLCSIPDDAIISRVLNSIQIENPFIDIEYNNLHSVVEPSVDLELAEEILQAQNSFHNTLLDNLNYNKSNTKSINYMDIIEEYLPEYFNNSIDEGFINILEPYRITNIFRADYNNIDTYLDEKTKIINSKINSDMNKLLIKSFDLDIYNTVTGRELYKKRLIPLPYKVHNYPDDIEQYLEKNYINLNK